MSTPVENAELKLLTKKRGSIKGKLTAFEKYLKSVEGLQTIVESVERFKVIELEQRMRDAECLLAQFDEIQNEIDYILDLDDSGGRFSEREEFNNRYYSAIARSKTLFEILNPNSDNRSNSSVHRQTFVESNANISEGIKLPDIKLPKFDGSFQTWLDFRDIFDSMIHKNTKINEIQKFHYLRASLTGTAPQVIQAIEFCSENYKIAWDTLCERFNNTSLLIQNHISAIFNMAPVISESAEQIRNLSDNLFKHLNSLKQLGEPTQHWDTLIIYIISAKLDQKTAREWEGLKLKQRQCTLEYFKKYLRERADLLENIEINLNKTDKKYETKFQDGRNFNRDKRNITSKSLVGNARENERRNENKAKYMCYLCKKDHSLFYCPDFLSLSVNDRITKVKELQLCHNCLRRNHFAKDCKWNGCKLCNSKHNTTLHIARENSNNTQMTHSVNSEPTPSTSKTNCNFATAHNAILCTANVQVSDASGLFKTARALLDCGSQSSFVTTKFFNSLHLPKIKTNLTICGIGEKTSNATYKCTLKLRSMSNDYNSNLNAFVLNSITSNLPDKPINRKTLKIPADIQLADPKFDETREIDLLIGADLFWDIVSEGKISLEPNGRILQNTRLGWIVAGPSAAYHSNSYTLCNLSKTISLKEQISKFWEVEEISNNKPLSYEEALCEKHFVDNLKLSPEGRYVVSLPLKDSPTKLGNSRDIAIKRLISLERKLHSNETLRKLYVDFLNEYEILGHMTEVKQNDSNCQPDYYFPHHGVLKESSSTTKLRVVFDGSSPSSTGVSINDLQMTGPIIQSDLISILLRFRIRPIVVSGDIRMMYRQVLINPEQRQLQKIVWRSNPNEPIKTFQLNTVTYGTTAGSFLAIRCIHEVANECVNQYPQIANILQRDMYVDDLLTSLDSVEEAKFLISKISELLSKRGFELRKWKSNEPSAISDINHENSENAIEFTENKESSKVLGLLWLCDQDILTYKISSPKENNKKNITKRLILSRIATIFDPLGLASPSIIIAKVLLQKLWMENLTWDQPLPNHILNSWLDFASELDILNSIKIERRVVCDQSTSICLQGFSDASETSYGACVYILSTNAKNETMCNLLCAKSKVAPLKTLTMPRLELCAALLLSQLVSKVVETVNIKFDRIFCWSDSTIVLGWLQTSPNLLKPFVNNRVAEIQRSSSSAVWRHVPTKDNPADLVSRGVRPRALIESQMWWHGPSWLLLDQTQWPESKLVVNDLPEMRNFSFVASAPTTHFPFERFSTLNRLKRTCAYVLRFLENSRKNKESRNLSNLSVSELDQGFNKLIKIAQQQCFPEEYVILNSKRELSSTSKILSLHPFIDDNGLIRVGGRLSNSDYSYSKKYPILLSPQHHLTKLIVEFEHVNLLHAGPQMLLSNIRENFWPIAGRNLTRKIVRNCVTCARYSSSNFQPIMGNLPATRVHSSLPFVKVGVDYSGPFLMKDRRGRGCKTIKVWVAVFVCFSTRAIHLELVLSLSSEDFLQAFNRFIGRRGKPEEVFSDNGTNFVRANKELKAMGEFLQENNLLISESVSNLGIKWHFIPTNSPHFGGIWEAGVRSVKHHLKRVLGSYSLFFFDFQTLLVRIESVLNSRPISPLSSNPDDLTSLTPAHFLIGRSFSIVPESSLCHLPDNRLSQFQLIQKVYEQFWNRWQREFISELQERKKWKKTTGKLNIGQLVLIKDSNVPPMRWRLGRVLNLVLGKDGVGRVASVKTSEGIVSRAVVRLCPLPVESDTFQGGGHVDAVPVQTP